MEPFAIWIVSAGLCLMLGLLIADRLRPGFVLFSGVVLFMCTGILSPREALAGFACSRSTNEDIYMLQKMVRTAFKSNNTDNCARV